MPVVKGGVWTNIEDEILKASVSKYGLNQWARVSSLLARKTPKQCKARWSEWLDPAIKKIEWSKEEDEKLLHLAKLMPTQWRTIAPIVGRTATQCLDRYQKLLDDAEARENDELALGGPDGAETQAPSSDDVRKLRPGELDPDPESKPAKPDTIDMDEDEKEMLSEARARLANTQGKKAKRKARERQLEESRRLAVLQKRRELKNAGINIKITHRKKGQMDYNADIPFEKAPAPGFYDTREEIADNDKEKEAFDPRKQQLARKRQGDPEDGQDSKRQKQDKGQNDAAKAAARAAQIQRVREAEQQSKRRPLNLPAPQVSDAELEGIIKTGMAGDRASRSAADGDRSLISDYSNIVGQTPIRTPQAPAQEDHISNELRNIKALTNTQSSLLGGENTPLQADSATTGFQGATPRQRNMVTPNPMATPMGQRAAGPGATPFTPRDNFAINDSEQLSKAALRAKLASLPRPKASEFELELPEEQAEAPTTTSTTEQEDQEDVDRRNADRLAAERAAAFARQTQVIQRNLPRPSTIDYASLIRSAKAITDPIRSLLAQETASLLSHDALNHPIRGQTPKSTPQHPTLRPLSDTLIASARSLLAAEASSQPTLHPSLTASASAHPESAHTLHTRLTTHTTPTLLSTATALNAREKKLSLVLGGYAARQKTMCKKIRETHDALLEAKAQQLIYEEMATQEDAALRERLERKREEVGRVLRREREEQEAYRAVRDELMGLGTGVNGHG